MQTIQGINITTFNSQLEANTNALKASIALCMVGVDSTNIQNLVVTAATRRLTEQLHLRVASVKVMAATSGSIAATYVVAVNTAGASYSTLSSELATNVANGNFDTFLATETTVYGGSPALAESTSTNVATTNLVTGTSSSDKGLSTGATVGIALGCAGFVVLIFGLAYFFMYSKSGGGSEGALAKQASAPPAVAEPVDKVPSTGSHFTDNPVMQQQKRTSSLNRDTSTSAPKSPLNEGRESSVDSRSGKRGSQESKRASQEAARPDNNL